MSRDSSIWSVPFFALMTANFFYSVSSFAAHATLPVFAHSIGTPPSMVGIVYGSFAFSALLIRPFAGPAFDSFSRKRLLVFSLIILAISFGIFAMADSVGMLIVGRLLQGVGIGCVGPLAMSLVAEYLPKDKFASGISIFALSQSLAQVLGPACGLFLMEAAGFPLMCVIAAVTIVIGVLSVAFLKEPYRELLPYKLELNRIIAKEALSPAAATMFLATSFACTTAYVVLYGETLGVGNLGVYFSVYAAGLLLTRPIFGRLSDRFGAPRMLLVGIFFFAAQFVALHLAQGFGGFMFAAVLGAAGYGACVPLLQALALLAVPEERRGAASNTAYTGLDVGMLCGPVIGGVVIDGLASVTGDMTAAYSDMWIAMLVPIAIAASFVLYWNIRHRFDR